ncbi:MAG: septum formation initiator family protein [Desulfuromonadales bacterium]|nr:MAG: septum formation initiator family protein [Desulfuromonadales bacterium]
MRKRMYFIPAGCILFILYFTIFGERGLLRIYHLSNEKEQIREKVGEIRSENDKLKREIEALKTDRRYLESIARKDFGLVRPNEIVYQFPTAEKQELKPQKAVSTAVGSKR